jgi:hypothetical protein
MSAALGFPIDPGEKSTEERDLQDRSSKKVKGGDQIFNNAFKTSAVYDRFENENLLNNTTLRTYKESMLGVEHDNKTAGDEEVVMSDQEEDFIGNSTLFNESEHILVYFIK